MIRKLDYLPVCNGVSDNAGIQAMLGDEALLMKLLNGTGIPRLMDLQYLHTAIQAYFWIGKFFSSNRTRGLCILAR